MENSAQKGLKLRINLNLLHPQGAPQKITQRFLKWLLQYGRFIVVFVEIIVVSAFVYRFKLDADLGNLKNQINNDIPFITGRESDEIEISQTHLKLKTITDAYNEADGWQRLIPRLNTKIPSGVTFTNLTIERTKNPYLLSFKITGIARSNGELSYYINTLKSDTELKNISLTNISFDQSQVLFGISGALK